MNFRITQHTLFRGDRYLGQFQTSTVLPFDKNKNALIFPSGEMVTVSSLSSKLKVVDLQPKKFRTTPRGNGLELMQAGTRVRIQHKKLPWFHSSLTVETVES